MRRTLHLPLRARLTVAFAVGMALVLLLLGTFAYLRLRDDVLASVDMGLRSRAQVLSDALGNAQEQTLVSAKGALIDPDEAFAQVLGTAGEIIDASQAVADHPLLTAAEIGTLTRTRFLTRDVTGFDDPVRLLATPARGPSGAAVVVVVGATLGDMRDALASLLAGLLTAGPAALLITTAAGWLLATAALRPVEEMRREAAAISASDPARRLPVPGTGDELARLATTLNSMLDRLQEALEREHRFVDDASHELRTPLTTLRGEIELALARGHTVTELEASLRSVSDDVRRLQDLAEDMLVLARSRGGRVPVRRVPVPLTDLVSRSIRSTAVQAHDRGVAVFPDATADLVNVDPERVEQALRNLLENAIRHTPRGGQVHVRASRVGGAATFAVEDSGPGFADELLTGAFDPFVRADQADGPAGTGLGLSIVQAVAEAHGGTVFAENMRGGARVTLTLGT